MATIASIFALKLENKDFNSQMEAAAKLSRERMNEVASATKKLSELQIQQGRDRDAISAAQINKSKTEIALAKQALAITTTQIQAEKSRLAGLATAGDFLKDYTRQVNEAAKAVEVGVKTEIDATKRRNEVLTSLNAQRVAEEKSRYATIAALNAQKSKEAADAEIAQAKRRNEVLTSLNAQRVAEEKRKEQFSRTYESTPEINKYNDAQRRLQALKSEGVITQAQYNNAIKQEVAILKEGSPIRDSQYNHMIRMMRQVGTLVGAYYALSGAYRVLIGQGVELNRLYESQSLGLSAILASKTKMIDANGAEVTGVEKLRTAQVVMAATMDKIKESATKTPATFSQMVGFYQQAIGHALTAGKSFGDSITEISDNTIKLTQRMSLLGSAIGMPMDRINEEIRSLMSGNASTDSLLASLLFGSPGDANNAVKEAKKRAGGLTELFNKVLSDVDSLMGANTFDMLKNNLISTIETVQKASSKPIFDDLKIQMDALNKYLKSNGDEIATGFIHTYERIKIGTGVVVEAGSIITDAMGSIVDVVNISAEIITDSFSEASNEMTKNFTFFDYAILGFQTLVTAARVSISAIEKEVNAIPNAFENVGRMIANLDPKAAILKNIPIQAGVVNGKRAFTTIGASEDARAKYGANVRTGADSKFDKSADAELAKLLDTFDKLRNASNTKVEKSVSSDSKRLEEALAKLTPTSGTQGDAEAREKEAKRIEALKKALAEDLKKLNEETALAGLDAEQQARLKIQQAWGTDLEKYKELSGAKADLDAAYYGKLKTIDDQTKRDIEAAGIQAQTDNEIRLQQMFDDIKSPLEKLNDDVVNNYDFVAAMFKSRGEDVPQEFFDSINDKYQALVQKFDSKDFEIKIRATGFDELSTAIAGITNSIADMTDATDQYNQNRAKYAKDPKSLAKNEFQYQQSVINGYANMTGALIGFTQKGSAAQKALANTQKGIQMYQMAMQIKEIALQNAYIASLFTKEAAVVATGATEVATNVAVTASNIPAAITGASIGVGPTGLITGAAMVAFLASMGFFSSGSSSTSPDAFSAMAANTGTGSVLGDTSAQSESIANSIALLADLAKPEFRIMSQMAKSLQSIDTKIGGVTSLLLRQGGFAFGDGYEGFDTGYTNNLGSGASGVLSTGASIAGLGMAGGAALGLGSWAALGSITPVGIAAMLADKFLLGGTLTNMINGIMGSVIGGLFGKTSVSQTMTDSGIFFANALLKNAVDDFNGSAYQTISTTVKKKSWFSSSSSTSVRTIFGELDNEVERQFSLVLDNLYQTTLLAGDALDSSSASIDASLSDFIVSIGKISLKGKTGTQIQETISAIFGKIGDDIAKDVFPLLIPFQKVGEGLFETMTRVASGMEQAEYYINRLGNSFSDLTYTAIIDKQGDVGVEALRQAILALEGTSSGVSQIIQSLTGDVENLYSTYVALQSLRFDLTAIGKSADSLTSAMLYGAGGIEALQAATGDYIGTFLTDQEQVIYKTRLLQAQFTSLGLSLPASNAGFRALIESIDVSTEAGQDLFGRVVLLSGGFADLTDTVSSSLKSLTDEAQSLSDAFTGMVKSIQDTIDKLGGTNSGASQVTMISSFWAKRAQADILLGKRGDLSAKEQSEIQTLVSDINSLALGIQGAQLGDAGAMTATLIGQLTDLKNSVAMDGAIIQSRIVDSTGATVDIATEGTLTRLANALSDRNAVLGIDGSHANGLDYVPYDGYIAQLHKGERVLTASEAGRPTAGAFASLEISTLEAVNNLMYDRLDKIYSILSSAQIGTRPLHVEIS